MSEERSLRQNSAYLRTSYVTSNYDDYLLVDIKKDDIIFLPFGQSLLENVYRERLGFDSHFYQRKLFSIQVLKKELKNDLLFYQCGTLFFDGRFYPHPLDCGNLLINSIIEDTCHNGSEKPNVEVNISLYKFDNFEPFKVPLQSNNMAELQNDVDNWHKPYTFDFSFKVFIYGRTARIAQSINHVRAYISLGLDIKKLRPIIPPFQFYEDLYTIPEKVFKFCNNLNFKSWSKVTSRVGKDNRMEGGDIIENLGSDIYLRKILSEYRNYKMGVDGRLKSDDTTDYGYVPSSPYEETEYLNSNTLRNSVIAFIILKYNAYDDFLYNLQIS